MKNNTLILFNTVLPSELIREINIFVNEMKMYDYKNFLHCNHDYMREILENGLTMKETKEFFKEANELRKIIDKKICYDQCEVFDTFDYLYKRFIIKDIKNISDDLLDEIDIYFSDIKYTIEENNYKFIKLQKERCNECNIPEDKCETDFTTFHGEIICEDCFNSYSPF